MPVSALYAKKAKSKKSKPKPKTQPKTKTSKPDTKPVLKLELKPEVKYKLDSDSDSASDLIADITPVTRYSAPSLSKTKPQAVTRPQLTEEEAKRYNAEAVNIVLTPCGGWPECTMNEVKLCCIDQLEGSLWVCVDCRTVYRKPVPGDLIN